MKKGGKFSPETIAKAKATKQAKFLSKLDIKPWEDYLDSKLQFGSGNKKKKVLTLREFWHELNQGKRLVDLQREGYDKHLLFFYSKLLQGEINLSKEKLIEEYEKGVELHDIGKKYGLPHGCIRYLREIYGIKKKGATFMRRKRTEEPLTEEQKQLIRGSLLGDGKRMGRSSFSVKHSCSSREYLFWKHGILSNIVSEGALKEERSYDKRYGKYNDQVRFYTRANTDVEKIISEYYGSGRKTVTIGILDQLSDFALSVWYMDDGRVDWHHRSRKLGHDTSPIVDLCTDSFSKEECNLICEWFVNKYNLEPYLLEHRPGQYRIRFNAKDSENFILLVRPHVPAPMQYKVSYDSYLADGGPTKKWVVGDLNLSECPTGKLFCDLDHIEQDEWVGRFVIFFRRYSFPYPFCSHKKKHDYLRRLAEFDTSTLVSNRHVGWFGYPLSFLQSYHHHIYEMKSKGSLSPCQIFNDDHMLMDAIRSLLRSGERPTENSIRHSVIRYRGNRGIGTFTSFGSKAVVDALCRQDGTVVDFCAGFGSRMLGAISSDHVASYKACEPCTKTYAGLKAILSDAEQILIDKCDISEKAQIYNTDALSFLSGVDDASANLVFTSPPYFNTEMYDSSRSQSSVAFHNYGDWLESWLRGCVVESLRILEPGGVLAINIANSGPYKMADDLVSMLEKLGYNPDIWYIHISALKTEPLVVARKKEVYKTMDEFD